MDLTGFELQVLRIIEDSANGQLTAPVIARELQAAGRTVYNASLYPLLVRLVSRGYLGVELGRSPKGKACNCYVLQDIGRGAIMPEMDAIRARERQRHKERQRTGKPYEE